MLFFLFGLKISKYLQICRNFQQNRLVSLKSLEKPADLHLFSHPLEDRPKIPADLHLFGDGSLEASTLGASLDVTYQFD